MARTVYRRRFESTFASLTHTAPPYDPPGDFTRYGYRVSLVVISPFTKAHCVSHVTTDYTAWLKFVEKRFKLPSLTARDGWSNTSDVSDFFDFRNPPWTTPPASPSSDAGGSCYDGCLRQRNRGAPLLADFARSGCSQRPG